MPYDPTKRAGWAKGLIHFHTKFSDGKASVRRAGEIALARGYDFLIITDHLQDLKLKTRRSFEDYIGECDEVTENLGLLVLPGGEFEVKWSDSLTRDESEGHTLTLSIRRLVERNELLNADARAKPYDHWADSVGGYGTILAIQEKLRSYDLPILVSHQFTHSLISYGGEEGHHPDFRYDLRYVGSGRALDFFYSGTIDVAHEVDDFALYQHLLIAGRTPLPCIYSSCDYHIGPEILFPSEGHEDWNRLLARLLGTLARNIKLGAETTMHAYFAPEQLTHATYVWLGDTPLTEQNILEAFRHGRTAVTRGEAELERISPAPGTDRIEHGITELRVKLSKSYDFHRPRTVFVLRDGNVIYERSFHERSQLIDFGWIDETAEPGPHWYVLYIPTKLMTSPIFINR